MGPQGAEAIADHCWGSCLTSNLQVLLSEERHVVRLFLCSAYTDVAGMTALLTFWRFIAGG